MERIYVGKTCPYCKTPFKQEDVVVFCNTCSMPHHLACWQANEGCSTYGCSGLIDTIINQENANKMTAPSSAQNGPSAGVPKPSGQTGKFETIFEITDGKVQEDVPVLIEKISLIKDISDASIFARCSFRSLTDEPIKALLLDIKATDVWGNSTEGVEGFQLLDLKTKKEAVFGQTTPIPIPNKNVREIDVIIRKILYEDRRMVECNEASSAVPMQPALLSVLGSKDAVEHFAELTTKSAKLVPVVGEKIWRCTCGATNNAGEDICYSCKSSLAQLQDKYNPEKIIAETNAIVEERRRKEEEIRLAREREQREAEERLRKAQEEKERQEREEKEAKKAKRKKTIKGIAFATLGLILLAGAIYGSVFHLIPYIRYSVAGSNVEKQKFDSAYNTYIALGDYRDSADKAIETLYAKAVYLEEQEQFADAAVEYEKIPDYQDSGERAVYCRNEANYRDAKSKYEAEEYDEALTLFAGLGDYADSEDWVKKIKYAKASELFANKDYAMAADLFEELGNYEDSKDRMKESIYQMAETAYANKDYKTAYEGYRTFGFGYKDAADKAKDAKYLYADECLTAKKYKEALDLFKDLKDYKDGLDKFNEATYAYAKECLDAKKYEIAKAYFGQVKGYEDADTLFKEASYYMGVACINSKDYKLAVNYFEDAEDYSDAKTKVNEAKYSYVQAHMNNTDRTTYSYLQDLKSAGYSDAKDIYNDLYAWKASIIINSSRDGTYSSSKLSKYDTWYCHIELSGGPPGESTTLKAVGYFPNGGTATNKWEGQSWYRGESGTCWYYYSNPAYGSTGTFTIKVYDGNGNMIGSESVRIY